MNDYVLCPSGNELLFENTELTLGVVCPDGSARRLYFHADGGLLSWRKEAFAMSVLIAAMARRRDIVTPNPLDGEFVRGVEKGQYILCDWFPALSRVRCDVRSSGLAGSDAPEMRIQNENGALLSFFSGGIDSFYTVLENIDAISALVFVAGFSPVLKDRERCQMAIASAHAVATALQKRLIVVTTNLREFMEEQIPAIPGFAAWEIAHGTALAVVAHLVAGEGGKVLVPATFCHQEGFAPWGSHPLLDPLWSSSRVNMQSDGYWVNRQSKIAVVAKHQVALDHLVVCYQRSASRFLNCGQCEKCLRTMIGLLACGALERCHAFGVPIQGEAIAALEIHRPEDIFPYECALRTLEQRALSPDIQKALRHMIQRNRWRTATMSQRLVAIGSGLLGGWRG